MRCFVLLMMLLPISECFSQATFSVDYRNQPLPAVIKDLKDRFDIKCSYNPALVKDHQVSLSFVATSKQELMDRLFRELPFEVKKTKRFFLLIPKKDVLITGLVLDKDGGKPMAFAHVKVGSDLGVVTDANGRFFVEKDRDTLGITVSHIGYKNQMLQISERTNRVVIELEQDSTILPEFILSSYDLHKNIATKTSRISLNPDQINSLPSIGQTDIFKSAQLMPGISATDESSAGLVIRGSTPSQNLVLFDGFTIYHLDHFFGIYSTFNNSTINQIDIYKGGFGAEYGGRISSVIDVTGKAGSFERVKGSVGLNVLSANGHIEVPVGRRSSFIAGVRSSTLSLVQTDLFTDFLRTNRVDIIESYDPEILEDNEIKVTPSVNFYDIYAKYRFSPSIDEKIDINFFASEDFYSGDLEDIGEFYRYELFDDASWSNLGLSISWEKYFNQNWSHKLVTGLSGYSSNSEFVSQEIFRDESPFEEDQLEPADTSVYFDYSKYNEVSDFTIKYLANRNFNRVYNLDFGFEYNAINTINQLTYFNEVETDSEFDVDQASLILSNNFNFNRLSASFGLRYQYYETTDFEALEPRLGLRYAVRDNLHFKGSYSRHHQFIHQLSLTPFGNSDQFYWIPAIEDEFPVQSSDHVILGAEYQIGKFDMDIEGYLKNSTGVLESDIFVDDDILSFTGDNRIKGLDVLGRYKGNNFETWISYTLSSNMNFVPNINDGDDYPNRLDQRHELNLAHIYKIGKWEFSSSFIYGSGRPYTPSGEVEEEELYNFEEINTRRLPEYHRLDLAAKYNFSIGKIEGDLSLTLFNLYNRKNVKSRRYGIRYDYSDFDELLEELLEDDELSEDEIEELEDEELIAIRIEPIDIILLGFTPNLSLNIRF